MKLSDIGGFYDNNLHAIPYFETAGGYERMKRFVQNNYGFYLDFSIVNENNVSVDLTDSTIKFKMEVIDGQDIPNVEGTCVNAATTGNCRYLVQPEDFYYSGTYEAELELQFYNNYSPFYEYKSIPLGKIYISEEIEPWQ